MDALTCRQLPPEEWSNLADIYRAQADELPQAEQNTAIVAEVDGRIVGMWGLNLIAHAGPLWVDPEWRGQGVPDRMGHALDELVKRLGGKGYLTFPSHRGAEEAMIRLGLTPTTWKVFKREF
jgi:GNAT superfamily N-acetyltransferase